MIGNVADSCEPRKQLPSEGVASLRDALFDKLAKLPSGKRKALKSLFFFLRHLPRHCEAPFAPNLLVVLNQRKHVEAIQFLATAEKRQLYCEGCALYFPA